MSDDPTFWWFIGMAFSAGLLSGFAIFETIDRTKWAAYRLVYRRLQRDR